MSGDTHHNSTFNHDGHPQCVVEACIIVGEGEKAQSNTVEVRFIRIILDEQKDRK